MRRLVGLATVFIALVGLVAAGLGSAAAQKASLADHPMTGAWISSYGMPPYFTQTVWSADGTLLVFGAISGMGAKGVEFSSPTVGTWEADDARTGHFTAVWVRSDADGVYLGTSTVEGYPKVSEDGQTFIDDNSRVVVTIRDPLGAITDVIHPTDAPPVTGIRMSPSDSGIRDVSAAVASPAP